MVVSVAVEQVLELMAEGVSKFHFFTLNKSDLAVAVCRSLGLASAQLSLRQRKRSTQHRGRNRHLCCRRCLLISAVKSAIRAPTQRPSTGLNRNASTDYCLLARHACAGHRQGWPQKENRKLDERFEQAIDMAAMRSGVSETDAYLEEWRRANFKVDGDLAEIADATQKSIEAEYDQDRLKALIANGGHATA